MKWLKVIYETIWFRCHPLTGPVAPDDPMPTVYPTWRHAFELVKWCVL